MPWPKTGATHYHALLGLPYKGRAIKELRRFKYTALRPTKLSGRGCNQPSPEV